MAKAVERRKGTATEHASFTGNDAELTVNTTNKSVHVHDGATAGGYELARIDLSNTSITASITELNYVDGVTSAIQTQLNNKANLSGANFTGNVDVTGTVTADGLTVSQDIAGLFRNTFSNTNTAGNQQTDINFSNNGDNLYMGLHYTGGDNAFLDFRGASDFLILDEGIERLRIDSSGNLLVGKTTADFGATAGVEARPDGRVALGRAGETLVLNRLSTDGAIALFRKDGSPVGSIGTGGALLGIGGGTGNLGFFDETIVPMSNTSGGGSNGVINLGNAGRLFKDLYLSGGVYLGGTGSANKLDDYEEGTWTPALGSGTHTYGARAGSYTKVGNIVTVRGYLNVSSRGSSASEFGISGLPFSGDAIWRSSVFGFDNNYNSGSLIPTNTDWNFSTASVEGAIFFPRSFYNVASTLTINNLNSSGSFYFTLVYTTTA